MYLDKQMSSRLLHISISDPGVYTLDSNSATGKSYIAGLLSTLDNVCVVTYNKVSTVLSAALQEAMSGKYELVFLDRCDLYMTKELFTQLLALAKTTIVILDLKDFCPFTDIVPASAQVILEDKVVSLI